MEQILLLEKLAADECPPAQPVYRSWRAIFQAEVFMAAAGMLLFFELVCGSLRRRSNNSFVHRGLWVAYTLLPLLITYTLGLMQSAHAKVLMYPVWALSLMIAGGATSITAHDLDDNKQWKRALFVILQYDMYFCIILFQLVYPNPNQQISVAHAATPVLDSIKLLLWHPIAVPVLLLFTTVCIAHTFGAIAGWRANYSYPSKMVADYMKRHAAAAAAASRSRSPSSSSSSGRGYLDPVSMKYLVSWPAYKVSRTTAPSGHRSSSTVSRMMRCQAQAVAEEDDEGLITVEKIGDWCCRNEDKFRSWGVSTSRIKGACLAYSLSHLLMRRFFGMDCAEASLPETRHFVLRGLLSESNTDEYIKAFRVIEVELAFLYDFFYTKYALIFGMEGFFFLMVLVKIVCASTIGVLMLYRPFAQGFPQCWYGDIVISPSLTSVNITVAIIAIFLTVEALQFVLYMGSDWAMVSLACCHITEGRPHGYIPLSFRKLFGFLFSRQRLPLFGYWQNKLGQYSVIQGSRFFSSSNQFAFECSGLTTFILSKAIAYLGQCVVSLFSSQGLHFVKLPEIIKSHIGSTLKSSTDDGGYLTNGKTSLQRNHVLGNFSWTLQNETQTESMLIWHIATDYCSIMVSDEGNSRQISNSSYRQHREVATKLSCYCAYLMSNVPQLLPGNSVDTKFVFDQAMYQAREALGTKKRDRAGLRNAAATVISNQDEGSSNSIFTKGLKLGAELASIQDDCLRWRVVAEFWVETILYIAPSENAKAHMECLPQGGEFLTHLWALLTHAGILSRQSPPAGAGANPRG